MKGVQCLVDACFSLSKCIMGVCSSTESCSLHPKAFLISHRDLSMGAIVSYGTTDQ